MPDFLRLQEEIAQDDRAEATQRRSKLRVRIKFFGQFRDLFFEFRVRPLACLFVLLQFCEQRANGGGGHVRLVESDVECNYSCAVVVQGVQHLPEILAGERPLPEHFLGALIDGDDDNAGVRKAVTRRAIAKTRVQGTVFEALQKVEERGAAVAKESEEVDAQRGERNPYADEKTDAVLPPLGE